MPLCRLKCLNQPLCDVIWRIFIFQDEPNCFFACVGNVFNQSPCLFFQAVKRFHTRLWFNSLPATCPSLWYLHPRPDSLSWTPSLYKCIPYKVSVHASLTDWLTLTGDSSFHTHSLSTLCVWICVGTEGRPCVCVCVRVLLLSWSLCLSPLICRPVRQQSSIPCRKTKQQTQTKHVLLNRRAKIVVTNEIQSQVLIPLLVMTVNQSRIEGFCLYH